MRNLKSFICWANPKQFNLPSSHRAKCYDETSNEMGTWFERVVPSSSSILPSRANSITLSLKIKYFSIGGYHFWDNLLPFSFTIHVSCIFLYSLYIEYYVNPGGLRTLLNFLV